MAYVYTGGFEMKAIIVLDKHETEMAKHAYEVTCAIESFYRYLSFDYVNEELNDVLDKKTLKHAIEALRYFLTTHMVIDLFSEIEDDDSFDEEDEVEIGEEV